MVSFHIACHARLQQMVLITAGALGSHCDLACMQHVAVLAMHLAEMAHIACEISLWIMLLHWRTVDAHILCSSGRECF